MKKRISKDEYYLGIAHEVSRRGECFRRISGAIIVRRDQIVATGYTGSPRKVLGCSERFYCLRSKFNIPPGQRYELCASVHAEQNAIINAARAGASVLGGDIFIFAQQMPYKKPIDAFPCFICKKMIINAGLIRVVCSAADEKFKIFKADEWVKEWQDPEKDIIDDKTQYGVPFKHL